MMQALKKTEGDFSLLCICILCPALVATVKGTEVQLTDIYRYYSLPVLLLSASVSGQADTFFFSLQYFSLPGKKKSAGYWLLWFLFFFFAVDFFSVFYSSALISQECFLSKVESLKSSTALKQTLTSWSECRLVCTSLSDSALILWPFWMRQGPPLIADQQIGAPLKCDFKNAGFWGSLSGGILFHAVTIVACTQKSGPSCGRRWFQVIHFPQAQIGDWDLSEQSPEGNGLCPISNGCFLFTRFIRIPLPSSVIPFPCVLLQTSYLMEANTNATCCMCYK